jgi:hypothetical protein
MKLLFCLAVLLCASAVGQAQDNPFLGKWDITGVGQQYGGYVYWLEVKMEDGKLAGYFLNRSGSVLKLPEIKIEGGELTFTPAGVRPNAPKPVHRAKVEEGRLLGMLTVGEQQIPWIGVRPPQWGNYNTNAKHTYGTPVALFDGKSLENFGGQVKDKELGWSVADGVMTNSPHANNLVSKHQFENFKIHCEYKLAEKSNSGIYLRGRYELQVLDDFGKEPEIHSHMSLYSRVAPKVNASLPVGQWQMMEAIIVGNRVSVWLNGKKVQDNIVIDGITGGALNSNEAEPGPIMLQGDHEKVWYRKVIVTPIMNVK